ncbi:hypothetical protein SAMN05661096_02694 [Marivirga sericea]|uniref:Uncharacterized protein n=1 Tax=Marivirga sericea TaxID=1028 RepID=A0A1X7KF41_9BACT|nr:hypothetical protein [Marivirga sericea]SMG39877.1 hypothetical protein SAMN05661096_02694 [Marivirga sericea]
MKKYNLIIVLSLFIGSVFGQGIDQQKMEKDLKVAQTVLNSFVNENSSKHWSSDREKETQYIEGYGVILSLPKRNVFGFGFSAEMPPMPPMPDISNAIAKSFEVIEDMQIDMADEEVDAEMRAEMEQERAERRKELAERQAELENRAAIAMERAQFKLQEMDSMRAQKNIDNTENVIDFLLDYGHLISQLDDSDKILVMAKGHDVRFYQDAGIVERIKTNRLSVEANMRDIRAFQAGKIDREEAKSRIVVTEKKEAKPLAKDLTLFQTILKRLYARDLSETYYLHGGMPYEQIEGLGVIFYMNMVSSVQESARWNVPTQDKQNLSQEERDNLIKSLYPKFEKELKKNIIEYGKSVKSLSDAEQLIFKVSITKCAKCEIPSSLELQLKGKTLNELNAGKLNTDQALSEIKVSKGELQ